MGAAAALKEALDIVRSGGVGRLDASKLESVLEAAVEQMRDSPADYHSEISIAVLKMYEMHPLSFNFETVKLILVLAMLHPDKTESALCLHSIPPNFYSRTVVGHENGQPVYSEPLSEVMQAAVDLDKHLRHCEYKQFWNKVENDLSTQFVNSFPGFRDSIRALIAKAIVLSHRRLSLRVAAAMLNLTAPNPLLELLQRAARATGQQSAWTYDKEADTFATSAPFFTT